MEQIKIIIQNLVNIEIIDILIALGIILLFRIFSSSIAYIIIRMFKIKDKKPLKIKENPFYNPIRVFIGLLGIYMAIIFLKNTLGIKETTMLIITKALKIITIIIFAKGISKSLTEKTSFMNSIRKRMKSDIDDSMIAFVVKIVKIIIYIIAAFLIITELGYDLNGLVTGLGITSVVITLAAQDTAKNLFGGLVIFFDKPFAVGDWISVQDYEGTVEDITFRSTRLRTAENTLVNIPNSSIANEAIINFSKMEKRRYKINLCIELSTPLEKVRELEDKIQMMLQERENVLDDSIVVKFDSITQRGINILIYSYTDGADYESFLKEKESINYKIMKILKEQNIKLVTEIQTLYLNN